MRYAAWFRRGQVTTPYKAHLQFLISHF